MVLSVLAQARSAIDFEIVALSTSGDKVLNKPLAEFGGTGVFVKELEDALLSRQVDLVVHSLKDMPTDIPTGLCLAATPARDDVRDVLVSRNKLSFDELPAGSRVATSSRRRAAQLEARRKDLVFVDIRGNVPTRLRKHDEGACDAMVLAAAGLLRLGLGERISEYFDPEVCMPAVGQGALAVECRLDDDFVRALLSEINDVAIAAQVTAERAFLRKLGGGCAVPIGALAATCAPGRIELRACIADGERLVKGSVNGAEVQAERLGQQLAESLLAAGGAEILESIIKRPSHPISLP